MAAEEDGTQVIAWDHGQLGLSLAFPPHQFPVHFYEAYATWCTGLKICLYQAYLLRLIPVLTLHQHGCVMCSTPKCHVVNVRSSQDSPHQAVISCQMPKYQWYGAHVGGPKYYAVNLILRLFLYHFLHTTSLWHHKPIHNNTNNQQTPPPCWWSRSPLQRRGFDESMPPDGRAALRIYCPRPPLKSLVKFNEVM